MRTLALIIVLLSVFSLGYAQKSNKMVRKGNKEYVRKNYSDAELKYRKALEVDPKSSKANNNLAGSLYKQEQYEAAESKYQDAIIGDKSKHSDMADYWYNLGNTYFNQQKLEKSINAYKESLRIDPSDTDAKHNLYLAQKMKQQQEQQQQQQQQQDQDKNKENKDENKDQQQNQDQNKDQQDQQNKDQQQQQQDQQNQDQQKKEQQQQQQQQAQQISKEDAERLLNALEQDENKVLQKVQEEKAKAQKVRVDKEW